MIPRRRIEEAWNSYDREVLPADAPPVQRQECRRAFYAGAMRLFMAITNGLTPGIDPQDEDVVMMEQISEELDDYRAELKRLAAGRVSS